MNKKPNVGGQAVIEGVMMRGKTHVAVAVRQPDGEISVDVRPVNSISDRYPILKKAVFARRCVACRIARYGYEGAGLIRRRYRAMKTKNARFQRDGR